MCPKPIVGIESEINWIRQAVLLKFGDTSTKERPKTVLALDANHAGVLTSKQIAAMYMDRYGDPRVEFGFAATWVVGPDWSTQIGSASWDVGSIS